MSDDNKERNFTIDLLRVIGTFLVILAHVNPPKIIATLRSFDVCLLVMVSGASYALSKGKKKEYKKYIIHRIKRLCIPAWITATIVFFICAMLCAFVDREYPYTLKQIIESYLFIGGKSGGIGFLWIVRIYLLIAIISPLLKKINTVISKNMLFNILLLIILVFNQCIYHFLFLGKNNIVKTFIENIIMSTLAYAVVTLIGIRVAKNKKYGIESLITWGGIALFLYIYTYINDENYVVSKYKYPPQMLYIVLGVFISLLLFNVLDMIHLKSRKILVWLSKESFNIYLSHIVVLLLMSWGDKYINKYWFFEFWITKYFIVMLSSIIISFAIDLLQNRVIKRGNS